MCKRSEAKSQSRPHIQLLADRSVVLVDTRGYESEIFLPEVHNGRVALRNVIYSRQPKSLASQQNFHSGTAMYNQQRVANRHLTTATAGLAPCPGRVGDMSSLSFDMKLISNGNVLLVECNGYESEIFVPHISSHCVAMRRVSAYELAPCETRRVKRTATASMPGRNKAASMGASLAHQAAGLSKMLIHPDQSNIKTRIGESQHSFQKEMHVAKARRKQKASSTSAVKLKRKVCKRISHESGDGSKQHSP